MAIDPYRVLGLPPGSSAADVKRAYRLLAKANHPDSAGAAALPRFLEIQRAYETLTTVTWRPGMRRPAPAAPSESWRADPTRARSTPGAEAPGARAPGGGQAAASSRRGEPTGRPTGAGSRGGAAGATPNRGSQATGGSRTAGPQGAGPRAPGGRPGSGAGATGAPGATGRRRTSKKATFGSTTYDEAREGSDTTWSGASWYGPSSGEYWRVNPREYADPRKHGPEYLAKAAARAAAAAERRARQAGTPEPGSEAESTAEADLGGDAADVGAAARPAGDRPSVAQRPRPPIGGPPRAAEGAQRTDDSARPSRGQTWAPRPPEAPGGLAGDAAAAGPPGAWALSLPSLNLGPGMRRLVRAVIAWPPLGIAAAAVIGEATGCAAFEATCTAPADLYPWLAQAAIVLALLAVPAVARVLAGGTIAVVLLAFPVAAVLSASGANYDRTYGPAALMSVLAIAWAIGVGAVLMRRAVTKGIP